MKRPEIVFNLRSTLLVLLLTALVGCGDKNAEKAKPVLPVNIVTATPRNVPTSAEFVGQTAGYREVEVRARVGGILLKKTYTEGRPVKQGELLFQIDPEPFQAALDQARGNLQIEQANLMRAQQDYKRIIPLFKENAVSQKDRDDATAAFASAKAAVAAAQAQVKTAQINLGYTQVTAPITGITSTQVHSEGSLVTSTGDGSPLTKISQLDPLYVNFAVSDNDDLAMRQDVAAGKLRLPPGQQFKVLLKLADGTVFPQVGKLNFTDSIVDTSTSSVRARAEFPNPDGSLLPGQFVRVRLDGAELINAIVVPKKAIVTTQQGKQVWVVSPKNTAMPVVVELGEEVGDQVVISKGLKAGDRVVVDNLMKIQPGMTLKPTAVPAGRTPATNKTASAPAQH